MRNPTFHTDEQCQLLFIDRYTWFLDTVSFAEHHGFTIGYADAVIAHGRRVHGTLTDNGED